MYLQKKYFFLSLLIFFSTFLEIAMTPIGKPPPNTFPYVDISDVSLNSFWTLEHLSLKPVIISSKINNILFFYKKSLKILGILNFHLLGDILV